MSPFRTSVIAVSFAAFAALPAAASVVTSGCAAATTCTLSELAAGGSLTIEDVLFDNFTVLDNEGPVGNPLDLGGLTVTGGTFGGVSLLFGGEFPTLENGPKEYQLALGYDAAVLPPSLRTFERVWLGFAFGRNGDMSIEVGTEVNGGEPDGELVEVFVTGSSFRGNDEDPLAGLTNLQLKTGFAASLFDDESVAEFREALLTFNLETPDTPDGVIPLPATGLLLAGGIGLLRLVRRRWRG